VDCGAKPIRLMEMLVISLLLLFLAMELYKEQRQVRKTAGWPGSWANFSFSTACCTPTGMHASKDATCIFWANLKPFSLQASVR
jgi:hypothetical protein